MPESDQPIIDIQNLDRAIRCANDAVLTINQLVEAGSHEPDTIDDVDPDVVVLMNRDFLIQFRPSLQAAGAPPMPQIAEAIIAADLFLAEDPKLKA